MSAKTFSFPSINSYWNIFLYLRNLALNYSKQFLPVRQRAICQNHQGVAEVKVGQQGSAARCCILAGEELLQANGDSGSWRAGGKYKSVWPNVWFFLLAAVPAQQAVLIATPAPWHPRVTAHKPRQANSQWWLLLTLVFPAPGASTPNLTAPSGMTAALLPPTGRILVLWEINKWYQTDIRILKCNPPSSSAPSLFQKILSNFFQKNNYFKKLLGHSLKGEHTETAVGVKMTCPAFWSHLHRFVVPGVQHTLHSR